MTDEKIQTFCRLRPVDIDEVNYEIDIDEDSEYEKIDFYTPKHHVNPFDAEEDAKTSFRFNKIFDHSVGQIDIFEMVAKEVLDHVLNGYNGTIFAYGQTGTGKTHTIVGKDKTPKGVVEADSGVIPRSLEYIFSVIEEMAMDATVSLSYMEIYKGVGYDLMSGTRSKKSDNRKTPSSFNELQIVVGRMGPKKKLSLVNLSLMEASSLNDAMKMFVAGSKNRQMAETGINDASSRSHCVFTVHINMKTVSQGRVLRPKINFVDLAGSERVGKHHEMSRVLLAEARTINLSLHHLQEVIVALGKSQNKRNLDRHVHVPFRNTMITNVLRESLGGNCKTSMIATVTPDGDNYNETLSTCKFSQRVAQIENIARVQHEIDFKVLASQLREENSALREKLSQVSENTALFNSIIPLEETEKDYLRDVVEEYLHNDGSATLLIENDNRKIQFCFKLLKYGPMFDREPSPTPPQEAGKHEKPDKKKKKGKKEAPAEHTEATHKKEEAKKAKLQKLNEQPPLLNDEEDHIVHENATVSLHHNGVILTEVQDPSIKQSEAVNADAANPSQQNGHNLLNGGVAANKPLSKKEQAKVNREEKKKRALEMKQEKLRLKEENKRLKQEKAKKSKKGKNKKAEPQEVKIDETGDGLVGNTEVQQEATVAKNKDGGPNTDQTVVEENSTEKPKSKKKGKKK